MMAKNAYRAGLVLLFVVPMASCAGMSIEEMGRNAIRESADETMKTFARITSTVDPADRKELARRLREQLPSTYWLTWTEDGALVNDLYFREHLTTSGGFFGQQRTVSACVRYTFAEGARAMRSINCPSTGPQSEHTDERVTVP